MVDFFQRFGEKRPQARQLLLETNKVRWAAGKQNAPDLKSQARGGSF
jgi:hypothetical protein